MSKICINPGSTEALEFIKTMKPTFGGFLSDNQIIGLGNRWIEYTGDGSRFPTVEEVFKYYQDKKVTVPQKEQALDVIQSMYFQGLMQLSESPIIDNKVVNQYSDKVLEQIPEFLREEGLDFIADDFEEYKKLLNATRFKKLNINIDDEFQEEESKDRIGDHSSHMDDLSQRASDEVKYLFASLEDNDPKFTDEFGISKPVNYGSTWILMNNLLENHVDLDEMLNTLRQNQVKYPVIKQILERLGDGSNNLAYSSLKTSFNEAFAKANLDITTASVGEKKSYSQVDMKIKQGLIAQAKSNFINSPYSVKKAGKTIISDEVKSLLEDRSVEGKLKFLNAMGIHLTELSKDGEEAVKYLMDYTKKNIDKGMDWLDTKFPGQTDESNNLDYLLNHLVQDEKQIARTSVRNAEKETVNTVANHSYFTRLFHQLRKLLTKNGFQELMSSGKLIGNIASGLEGRDDSKNFNRLGLGEIFVTKLSNMFSSEPSINIPVTSDKTIVRGIKIKAPLGREGKEEYFNTMMAYTAIGPQVQKRLYECYSRDYKSNFHPDWKYGSESPIDFWHGNDKMSGVLGQLDGRKLNQQEFKEKIVEWLAGQREELKQALKDSGAIQTKGANTYVMFNMPTNLKGTIQEKIDKCIDNANFNELLFGAEITQEMYGSMVNVKPDNFFKRNAGGVAEGRQLRVDSEMNNEIQNDRNNMPIDMSNYPIDKLRVFIHSDTMASATGEDIRKYHPGYDKNKINTDDAQGTMPLEIYREVLKRSKQWTDRQQEAFTRLLSGEKLGKDLKGVFPPIKPVGYSLVNKDGKKIPIYIKTAVYPIFKSDVRGTLNESKYDMMSSKGVGLVIPTSGIKMSTPKGVKPLFDGNNVMFDESNSIDFPMEDFRIQLDINPKESSSLLQGTQQRKLLYTDLFENGSGDEKYRKWLDENIETLQKISDIETRRLYEKAGIVESNGDFSIKNYSKLVSMLNSELLSRDMPVNLIEAVKNLIDEFGNLKNQQSSIDALPARQKFMNLLNSIVTNKLIKLHTHGSALVQISQIGWELKTIEDPTDENILGIKSSIDFVSDKHKIDYYNNKGLKFFSLGKNTGAAQIIIPAKYKSFVIKKDGKYVIDDERCLMNLGYRIPTQGHNSMLHLEVIGFLPEHMDQMVIMPKEITTQGGSDFDVDKLNLFVPNVLTLNGTKKFIDNTMDPETIWKEILLEKDAKKFGEGDIVTDKLFKEIFGEKGYQDEDFEESSKDHNLNKEEFIEAFKLKQAENELITQSIRILEDPKVRESLITPNSADKLKDEADKITKKLLDKGMTPIKIKPTWATMLSSKILSAVAQQMSAAKALVGVFASQSTNHTLAQQVGLHFKTGREFFFKHNTVKVGDETRSNLSGVYSHDKSYKISDMLGNQYLSASVDAAKDDYLAELGVNLQTGAFVAAYTRLGGSNDYLRYWMKNPIIQEYLKERELQESLIIQGHGVSKNRTVRDLVKKYGGDKAQLEYIVENYDKNHELAAEMLTNRKNRPDKGMYKTNRLEKIFYGEADNAVSLDLLNDYLYFEDASQVIGQNIANTKFDTDGPGKDIVETKQIQLNYHNFIQKQSENKGYTLATIKDGEEARYDRLVTDTQLNVFFTKSFYLVQSMYKDLVMLHKNNTVEHIMEAFMVPSDYTSKKASTEEAALVYGAVVNYILQNNNPLKEDLFYGSNSIASRVQKIQSDANHILNDNYVIKKLQAEINSKTDNPSLVGFKDKHITSEEAKYITKSFSEIKEYNTELYNDMILASLYQSGVIQSPLSYYNLIPTEDMSKVTDKALANHHNTINISNMDNVINSVVANIGNKLTNIQRVVLKDPVSGDLNGVLTIPEEDHRDKEIIKVVYSNNNFEHSGLYRAIGYNQYKFIQPANYKTLFYDMTGKKEFEPEFEDNYTPSDEEIEYNASQVRPDRWTELPSNVIHNLTNSGITKEEFNESTKEMQDQQIKCYGGKK